MKSIVFQGGNSLSLCLCWCCKVCECALQRCILGSISATSFLPAWTSAVRGQRLKKLWGQAVLVCNLSGLKPCRIKAQTTELTKENVLQLYLWCISQTRNSMKLRAVRFDWQLCQYVLLWATLSGQASCETNMSEIDVSYSVRWESKWAVFKERSFCCSVFILSCLKGACQSGCVQKSQFLCPSRSRKVHKGTTAEIKTQSH